MAARASRRRGQVAGFVAAVGGSCTASVSPVLPVMAGPAARVGRGGFATVVGMAMEMEHCPGCGEVTWVNSAESGAAVWICDCGTEHGTAHSPYPDEEGTDYSG